MNNNLPMAGTRVGLVGKELREFLRPGLDNLLKTHDHRESISAFLEKRAPIFNGH